MQLPGSICQSLFAILSRVQSCGGGRPSCLLNRLAPDVGGHGGQPLPKAPTDIAGFGAARQGVAHRPLALDRRNKCDAHL